ncbi:hypothetical protein ACFVU3_27110 [Streptomyces sp. NPDC058052]|uniref:hypothetical protein n=1 Tax=Streptomyces sp. NPDC058052 TaxID=3346316 RepID=UPI0036F0A46F
MSSVRTTVSFPSVLLLVLTLVGIACGLPSWGGATVGAGPQVQQTGVRSAASAAYEVAHAPGGEAGTPTDSLARQNRRRPATSATRPLGPLLLVSRRTNPLSTPPNDHVGRPDSRPRTHGGQEAPTLQVFLC